MPEEGLDEIVFAERISKAVGIVKGKPVRVKPVREVVIKVKQCRVPVVVVNGRYYYDPDLLEELARLWGVMESASGKLAAFLEDGVENEHLELLWFKGDEEPLLGFWVKEGVYAVITPLSKEAKAIADAVVGERCRA